MNINLVSTNKIINFAVDNLTLIIRESITPMRRLVLGFDQPPYSILGILLGCPFNFYWLPLWLPWTYYLKISFWKTHHIFIKLLYADGWSNYIYAVPARTTWRRPLMVRNLRAKRFWAPEGGYILSSLRFQSPRRGTWGGVKTIEERLGEKGGAFLKLTYKKEAIIQSPL